MGNEPDKGSGGIRPIRSRARSSKSGGKRIYERVEKANAKKLHSKMKKRKMTEKQKKERAKAQGTSKTLIGNAGHSEQIGNAIAHAVGVSSSQISQYVDGEVPDNDGDFFQSQEGLAQFRRLHTSQESSSDESDSEEK